MQIPMSFEHFQRMPRHPDWKYEYADGALWLSHRPRLISLERDLSAPQATRHDARPLTPADLPQLRAFLAEMWRTEEPYSVFDDAITRESLDAGLDDSFGRLAEPAGALVEDDGELIGATLVEHLREDADAPCLTWLSVRWGHRCDGVATVGRTDNYYAPGTFTPGRRARSTPESFRWAARPGSTWSRWLRFSRISSSPPTTTSSRPCTRA